MKDFKGIYPALLTPFDENDKINEKSLEKLIEMNIKKGVNGFYVGGSTGEAFLLSADERKYVYKLVADITKGRANLIAHIGSIGTKLSLDLAQYAESVGYDAVSSIPPFYYAFSYDEIKDYYFDLAKGTSIPMLIYFFPGFTNAKLGTDNMSDFLESDRFLGVKYTSNDFFGLERIKAKYPNKVVYNGFDEMLLSGLSMGADGGIGSTYNFCAEKYIEMYKCFNEGNLARCQELQKEVNEIIDVLAKIGVFAGEKEILTMMGIDFGKPRAPFKGITDDERALLRSKVEYLL